MMKETRFTSGLFKSKHFSSFKTLSPNNQSLEGNIRYHALQVRERNNNDTGLI